MKHQKKSSTISTVLGQPIPETPFDYEWDDFESREEVESSPDVEWPTEKKILAFVNDTQERNALSAARAEIVAKYAKDIRETPEFKRSEFIKAAVAFGMTQEQAEQLAASKL